MRSINESEFIELAEKFTTSTIHESDRWVAITSRLNRDIFMWVSVWNEFSIFEKLKAVWWRTFSIDRLIENIKRIGGYD